MAIKIRRSKRKARHGDIKPMINLVFLLLIFFMLTTTFDYVDEGQLKINFEVSSTPSGEYSFKTAANMFVIVVQGPNNVQLNNNSMPIKDAIDEIKNYKEHNGEIDLTLSVSEAAVAQDLVSTIDQLYLANIHEFRVRSSVY